MADVTGPISTLPGSAHAVPAGTMCDDHPNRPAVSRIQGETDSFGSEMFDVCQECLDKYREAIRTEDTSGTCDWCKSFANKLVNMRDYEEGMCGRVYQVCAPCQQQYNANVAAELDDEYDDWYFSDD